MKVIIAGSRNIIDYNLLIDAINGSGFEITEVVSGGAKGADSLGERYAQENNLPVKKFIPDWKKNGKSAGPIRNNEMANYGEAAIILFNGFSKGTKNMIETAKEHNLKLFVKLKLDGKSYG